MNYITVKQPSKREILRLKQIIDFDAKIKVTKNVPNLPNTTFRMEIKILVYFYSIIISNIIFYKSKLYLSKGYSKLFLKMLREKIFYYIKPFKKFSKKIIPNNKHISIIIEKEINNTKSNLMQKKICQLTLQNIWQDLTQRQKMTYITDQSYETFANKKFNYILKKYTT